MGRRRVVHIAGQATTTLDPVHREKIRRWVIRILLDFTDLSEFGEEKILRFLGMERERIARIMPESFAGSMDESELRRELERIWERLERTPLPTDGSILGANLDRLASRMGLSRVERDLLEFVVLLYQVKILDDTADLMGSDLSGRQVMEVLSGVLGYGYGEIRRAFSAESVLGASALLSLDRNNTQYLRGKLDFAVSSIPDRLYAEKVGVGELLGEILLAGEAPSLKRRDYSHLGDRVRTLRRYLREALDEGRRGVNLLLYGPPGTGKSELARLLAVECGAALYEVSQSDESGDPMEGPKRIRAYRSAQALLSRGRHLLLYDEAEDIFESHRGFFANVRQKDKAWINRSLERNPVPTVWITNRVDTLDPAIVRRFDLSLELPIPPRKVRRKILERTCGEILDDRQIRRVSRHPHIAPALMASAAKVASRLPEGQRGRELLRILDQTLRAQGHPPLKAYTKRKKPKKKKRDPLPASYDPGFLTLDTDPKRLAEGLRRHPNARLCFYGPPGTGKSAYGRWLARELERPVLLKKGSDLLSKWLGGTEQNIAAAFAEARKKKAVLIFDEVDSLLRDRRGAEHSWEVTQVNEMLVQMEEFDGIFIATTNLMEGLDQASLRRFDLKLAFGWLRSEQAAKLLRKECALLGVGKPSAAALKRLKSLRHLTPGDFAAVTRQHRFRPITSAEELVERLVEECAVKKAGDVQRMGFAV